MSVNTKKSAILETLRQRSLNRFEAERLGDHCLNSTIAELRADGYVIHSSPEMVETRFGRRVRVKRYHLIRGVNG